MTLRSVVLFAFLFLSTLSVYGDTEVPRCPPEMSTPVDIVGYYSCKGESETHGPYSGIVQVSKTKFGYCFTWVLESSKTVVRGFGVRGQDGRSVLISLNGGLSTYKIISDGKGPHSLAGNYLFIAAEDKGTETLTFLRGN